ncbi:MAG: GtrA family protein [Bacteroidetes bacterium]|nr:GtrA family protein [Bacteroidota bacterium]
MSKISNLIQKEFIRFAIVGVVATGIQYGVYLLFLQIIPENTAYQANIALNIGYVVSFVFNFILTSIFTFKSKANVKKTVGFVMSHAINLGLQNVLLKFFLWLSLPEILVRIGTYERLVIPKEYALIFVFAIAIPVNFLLVRFAFKSKWTQ